MQTQPNLEHRRENVGELWGLPRKAGGCYLDLRCAERRAVPSHARPQIFFRITAWCLLASSLKAGQWNRALPASRTMNWPQVCFEGMERPAISDRPKCLWITHPITVGVRVTSGGTPVPVLP